MDLQERAQLDRIFQPRGVAVFGGVHEPGKFGHMIIQSLLQYGYPGNLFPIHPVDGEVFGLKVRPRLEDVRGPVDLAVVCVPAEHVPDVLKACLKKGVCGAEILSSGFFETGQTQGTALQSEVLRLSKQGIRILGPNCFGIHCPKGGLTLLPAFDFSTETGPVALISQSGGVAVDFGHEAVSAGLRISKVLSFGNGCDLDAVTLLDYLDGDADTTCIGAYLEGGERGRELLKALKRLTSRKPVILWKGGLTPLGNRAARSHTGSLGGDALIWKGLFNQTGAVPVQGLREMVDTMTALLHLKGAGPRLALVGGGGAISVHASDLANRWHLEFPPFGPETRKKIRAWMPPPGNSVANPLDTGSPVIPLESMIGMTREILFREPVDVVLLVLLLHPMARVMPAYCKMDGLPYTGLETYLEGLLQGILSVKARVNKEVILIMENRANMPDDVDIEKTARRFRLTYLENGIPVYGTVEQALRALQNTLKAQRALRA